VSNVVNIDTYRTGTKVSLNGLPLRPSSADMLGDFTRIAAENPINSCCGTTPIILRCCGESHCRDCVEYIKCDECERIVYGVDSDSIKDWNNLKNDDEGG